eukprot:GABV01005632.1.p1 GENE.GABV01005632.1~~GABV01005632.1.p1  ORF type:complete len:111 (-),score=33.63 GABV01005632.1:3-311(-)
MLDTNLSALPAHLDLDPPTHHALQRLRAILLRLVALPADRLATREHSVLLDAAKLLARFLWLFYPTHKDATAFLDSLLDTHFQPSTSTFTHTLHTQIFTLDA